MDDVAFLKEWINKKNKEGMTNLDARLILNEFEQFLKYIFNSIQDGISILDKDLNILGTNLSMEIWYEHKKPFLGKKCFEIYHDRNSPCKNCPTINTIKTGKSMIHTIKYKTPNNKEGWHELFTFPLFDDQNNVISIIEYVRDITQRKKVEVISEKLKKRLHLQAQTLQEQETVLKYLFKQKEKEQNIIADNVMSNINLLIKPVIYDLKIKLKGNPAQESLNVLESYLDKVTQPFSNIKKLNSNLYNLTAKEIQVASLIMEGKTSKNISSILGISIKAVDFHRANIRKKLKIKNNKINLQNYLLKL
jgi:PAS domain S-box-containing protein